MLARAVVGCVLPAVGCALAAAATLGACSLIDSLDDLRTQGAGGGSGHPGAGGAGGHGATTSTGAGGVGGAGGGPPGQGIIHIAADSQHFCAINSKQTAAVYCWGTNLDGELGLGASDQSPHPIPAKVPGLPDEIVEIALGYGRSCARDIAGEVFCWGFNQNGQLGDGTTTQRVAPTAVSALNGKGVVQLSLGDFHSCALLQDGTVWCWGDNAAGELGLPADMAPHPTPTQVPNLSGVKQIAAGGSLTCALTTDGHVLCWGANYLGLLGNGSQDNNPHPTPSQVMTLSGVSQIALSVGPDFDCALQAGQLFCWGDNGVGQFGNGSTVGSYAPLASIAGIVDVALGDLHGCARKIDGSIECWGANDKGQLGLGVNEDKHPAATTVPGLNDAQHLALGHGCSCALTNQGAVYCWGDNGFGQLGDGTTVNRNTPTLVNF